MRYKLVLSVFAESDTMGEAVELCPGGLAEEYSSIDSLFVDLRGACDHGWEGVSAEDLSDFYTRLEHEADAVARILDKREQATPTGAECKGKKSRKAKPGSEPNAI